MLNQVIVVGRLTETPQIENGKAILTLAIPRSCKNLEGEYETDFISFTILEGIAKNVVEYCKKGDIIGVKGRTQSTKMASGYSLELVAEKITFLSSNKRED